MSLDIQRRERKYWKVYEETEYILEETSCKKCGMPFMVDLRYCPEKEIDGDYDFFRVICPYCGQKNYIHS